MSQRPSLIDLVRGPIVPGERPNPFDPTLAAVPFFYGSMFAEHLWLKHRAKTGAPTPGDYERKDTTVSLLAGFGSVAVPLLTGKALAAITPRKGKHGRVLLGIAAAAAITTTAADVVKRARTRRASAGGRRDRVAEVAGRVASAGAVATVATAGLAITTSWAALTTPSRLWRNRFVKDLGNGLGPHLLAIAGWDFIYYWNHRFMHEARYLWAVHVLHHSSERYNLSTALRQPVLDPLGTYVPYGALRSFGIGPDVVFAARGINLIYQYWIHTETIGTIGPAEQVLNTASHHRVHHGSNKKYIDRNHGSVVIAWDKLFGTFEPEGERVVYGLTKNIDTFNPLRAVFREHRLMLTDVASADNWKDRLSYVVRPPGWSPTTLEEPALSLAAAHR